MAEEVEKSLYEMKHRVVPQQGFGVLSITAWPWSQEGFGERDEIHVNISVLGIQDRWPDGYTIKDTNL